MSTQFPSSYPAKQQGASPQKRRGLPSHSSSIPAKDIISKAQSDKTLADYKARPLPSPPLPFLPGPSQAPNLPPRDYILSRQADPMEIRGSFLKPEHFEVFTEVFGGNFEEVRSIYRRMVNFARDSDVNPNVMVENVRRGKYVAMDIASGDFAKEYSAHDLVAFDWFLRSQHAKMDKLYLKGTMKFADPDHHFARFLHLVRGQYQGKSVLEKGCYPRMSSHLPEESKEVKNGLGIDTSGMGIYPPGKNSETYLFHFYTEKDQRSHRRVPVVLMKAESKSVAPVKLKKTWGSPGALLKDKAEHGLKLYKKFSSIEQKSLKEDKLPPSLCKHLDKVNIQKGEKDSALRNTYKALKKSTEKGNDASLTTLYSHLKLQLKSTSYEREEIQAVLNEIEAIFQKSEEMQGDSHHLLFPRGQEVILPSLKEILENKVKFVSNLSS